MKAHETPGYHSWANMIRRCTNANAEKYPIYGGRGIAVCDEWRGFWGFHADMGDKPEAMTLERIDVNGDYHPDNCKWATPKEQANNKRCNRLLSFGGKTMTTAEWADEIGISFVALRMRLHRGWSTERTLTEPLRSWPSQREI